MSIRHRIAQVAAVAAASALALTGCSSDASDTKESQGSSTQTVSLKVGASPTPHAKILQFIKDNLAQKNGLDLEIVQFQDYIQPNTALQAGDIDANYFQTVPYLEEQSEKQGYAFDHGKGIHLEPMGVYSVKVTDVKDVKNGATVGIINDPTNQARGLNLLSHVGLLSLPENASLNVSQVEGSAKYNPKGLKLKQIEGPQLIRALEDVDIAVINGNFAQAGGKSPKDAIALEPTENNPSVNILAWQKNTKKLEAIKKLDTLLHSDEVRDFIRTTWPDKSVLPAF